MFHQTTLDAALLRALLANRRAERHALSQPKAAVGPRPTSETKQ